MRLATNFHLWSAATWLVTTLLYNLHWSDLNEPLAPQLSAFLLVMVCTSLLLACRHHLAPRPACDTFTPICHELFYRRWRITLLIVAGFAVDFAYQGKIPLLSGSYSGFDVASKSQAAVGIPLVHVVLIAGAIFYAILLIDRFAQSRNRTFVLQFFVIQGLLLLNVSRGYMVFAAVGAIVLLAAYHKRRPKLDSTRTSPASSPRVLVLGAVAVYALLIGIGVFGNIRLGASWNDSSYITRIGRYNDNYPTFLDSHLKWAYTYATSPLGNLNFNVSRFVSDGSASGIVYTFVPETFSGSVVAERANFAYQVSYLNASTGYAPAYYLGGGMFGLYLSYFGQVLLLELGALIARRLGGAYNLYCACATVVVIVFVFYNSYSNLATCFLVPMALAVGFYRSRRRGHTVAGAAAPEFSDRIKIAGQTPTV